MFRSEGVDVGVAVHVIDVKHHDNNVDVAAALALRRCFRFRLLIRGEAGHCCQLPFIAVRTAELMPRATANIAGVAAARSVLVPLRTLRKKAITKSRTRDHVNNSQN